MVLERRTVMVPLIDGLSDNDDNFASDPPGWIDIAEARWSRDKQIGKRLGIQALNVPTGGRGFEIVGGAELVVGVRPTEHKRIGIAGRK